MLKFLMLVTMIDDDVFVSFHEKSNWKFVKKFGQFSSFWYVYFLKNYFEPGNLAHR